MTNPSSESTTILFGAFDRHNFGDMLFAHIVARMLPGRRLRFAGLAERDLRTYGGHVVESISTLASACRERTVDIVHVGGELLTCDAWEAAVMLSSAQHAKSIIGEQAAWQKKPVEWAEAHLGLSTRAPYVLSRTLFPQARRVLFNAIGGVDLDRRDNAMRAQVIEALRLANDVTVRDSLTRDTLDAAGIATQLLPDPAVMVAALFGDDVRRRAEAELVSSIRHTCPNGYIAVQFSADFGDDRTLSDIAAQLDIAAQSHGLGIAFFAAGTAPWHDDLAVYERTRQRMRTSSVHCMYSADIWDICALIASSRVYCGSSLHGRIVAAAFGLPRVNVRHPARTEPRGKQSAFALTWDDPTIPAEVDVGQVARGIDDALRVERAQLRRLARTLVHTYQTGFARVPAILAGPDD
ncbi:polysaccharide pyruvyl transferase family protein [Trinickia sp.]|uniref:polysaccharide pyruvyl transferase family protein n=1 Tax=Trinickia sp. TaxID=2571163 RepID=UPI003F7FB3EA